MLGSASTTTTNYLPQRQNFSIHISPTKKKEKKKRKKKKKKEVVFVRDDIDMPSKRRQPKRIQFIMTRIEGFRVCRIRSWLLALKNFMQVCGMKAIKIRGRIFSNLKRMMQERLSKILLKIFYFKNILVINTYYFISIYYIFN